MKGFFQCTPEFSNYKNKKQKKKIHHQVLDNVQHTNTRKLRNYIHKIRNYWLLNYWYWKKIYLTTRINISNNRYLKIGKKIIWRNSNYAQSHCYLYWWRWIHMNELWSCIILLYEWNTQRSLSGAKNLFGSLFSTTIKKI